MKTIEILKPLIKSGILRENSPEYYATIRAMNIENRRVYDETYNEAIDDAAKKVWNYTDKQGVLDLKKRYSMG